jgi:hypothetical protein
VRGGSRLADAADADDRDQRCDAEERLDFGDDLLASEKGRQLPAEVVPCGRCGDDGGRPASAASTPCSGGLQRARPVCIEPERAREPADGFTIRRLPEAPLEGADGIGAECSPFRQRLLRESGFSPITPEEFGELVLLRVARRRLVLGPRRRRDAQ